MRIEKAPAEEFTVLVIAIFGLFQMFSKIWKVRLWNHNITCSSVYQTSPSFFVKFEFRNVRLIDITIAHCKSCQRNSPLSIFRIDHFNPLNTFRWLRKFVKIKTSYRKFRLVDAEWKLSVLNQVLFKKKIKKLLCSFWRQT